MTKDKLTQKSRVKRAFETWSQRRKNEKTFGSLNFPRTNPILFITTPWLIPLHLLMKQEYVV